MSIKMTAFLPVDPDGGVSLEFLKDWISVIEDNGGYDPANVSIHSTLDPDTEEPGLLATWRI